MRVSVAYLAAWSHCLAKVKRGPSRDRFEIFGGDAVLRLIVSGGQTRRSENEFWTNWERDLSN